MENISEQFLRELAFLNPGNEKILSLIRKAYRSIMDVRQELAKYEIRQFS